MKNNVMTSRKGVLAMSEYNSPKDKIEIFFMKVKLKIQKFLKTRFGAYLWRVVSTALILGVAGGIGVFAAVVETEGSSEGYAKKYFDYFMTHTWSPMYKATDLVDSKFINETAFGEMMGTIVPERGSDEFKFVNRGTDGNYTLIDVVYEETDSDIERVMTLRMHKKDEKAYLFLNQWEVCLSSEIIQDCTITAPNYLQLSLNGISLADCEYTDDEETGMRTYKIDEVLSGTHKVEVTAPGGTSVYETFLWQNSGSAYTVQTTEVALGTSATNIYSDKAIDMIIAMYTGVLTGSGIDAVKSEVTTDDEKAALDAVYAALSAQVNQEDGSTLTNMTFDSYTTTIIDYSCAKSFGVHFVFDTTFEAKESRTQISGVRDSYSGTTQGEAVVRFVCRDGQWMPSTIEMNCFDYSEQEEE